MPRGRNAKALIRSFSPSRDPTEGELQFFHELAMHQDREWFQQHLTVYENEVQRPMAALVTALAQELRARAFRSREIPNGLYFAFTVTFAFPATRAPTRRRPARF